MIFQQFENITKASIDKDLIRGKAKRIEDKFDRLEKKLQQLKQGEFGSYEQELVGDIENIVDSIHLEIL